jgi:hypothetical protein
MYSLIVTAKMNDIDLQAWLADVLARITAHPAHPAHRLDEFVPWNWTKASVVAAVAAWRPELGSGQQGPPRPHHYTIARVAEMLGENEEWLWDVVTEMDQEDGLIWIYGAGDDSVMGFTDFGIETLTVIVEIHKADPSLLKRATDPD